MAISLVFLILQLSCAVCDGHRMSGVSYVHVCWELNCACTSSYVVYSGYTVVTLAKVKIADPLFLD